MDLPNFLPKSMRAAGRDTVARRGHKCVCAAHAYYYASGRGPRARTTVVKQARPGTSRLLLAVQVCGLVLSKLRSHGDIPDNLQNKACDQGEECKVYFPLMFWICMLISFSAKQCAEIGFCFMIYFPFLFGERMGK
jgi:hypothetical protein